MTLVDGWATVALCSFLLCSSSVSPATKQTCLMKTYSKTKSNERVQQPQQDQAVRACLGLRSDWRCSSSGSSQEPKHRPGGATWWPRRGTPPAVAPHIWAKLLIYSAFGWILWVSLWVYFFGIYVFLIVVSATVTVRSLHCGINKTLIISWQTPCLERGGSCTPTQKVCRRPPSVLHLLLPPGDDCTSGLWCRTMISWRRNNGRTFFEKLCNGKI